MVENFLKNIKLNNKTLPLILAVLGILLLSVSYIMPKSAEKTDAVFNESEYISSLEKRVENLVSQISGAGDCNVMISINSSVESVYVKENKNFYNNSSDTVKSEKEDSVLTMKDSNGNEYAVITKTIMPQLSGVTVVCDGGNNLSVKNNVISAVSTLLGIGSNKVCVIAKAN